MLYSMPKNKDFQDDLEEKNRDLSRKQRQGEAIEGAIRDLQDKRISLQRDFGSAIDSICSARSRVEDSQCKSTLFVACSSKKSKRKRKANIKVKYIVFTYTIQ